MPVGSYVALVSLRAARRWPFLPARKRFLCFHTVVSSTPESEISRRRALGLYVMPDGSGLGVDQAAIIVTRTTLPSVAARAGCTSVISEPTTHAARTKGMHRFIGNSLSTVVWPVPSMAAART